METKELIEHHVGFLRQWLNEDRITDPSKLVTNADLEHWLAPVLAHLTTLERRAEASDRLEAVVVKALQLDRECKIEKNVFLEEGLDAYRLSVMQ